MLESAIQAKILKHLRSIPNCWAIKVVAANCNGTPDILACINGQFYAFEVKNERGRLSPIQQVQLDRIASAQGKAYTVRSLEEVIQIIQ